MANDESVHVLLKGSTKEGTLSFHGVVFTESEADVWNSAAECNWTQSYESSNVELNPVEYDED